jgi:hypothetical protein
MNSLTVVDIFRNALLRVRPVFCPPDNCSPSRTSRFAYLAFELCKDARSSASPGLRLFYVIIRRSEEMVEPSLSRRPKVLQSTTSSVSKSAHAEDRSQTASTNRREGDTIGMRPVDVMLDRPRVPGCRGRRADVPLLQTSVRLGSFSSVF